jgi:hypothetical protein
LFVHTPAYVLFIHRGRDRGRNRGRDRCGNFEGVTWREREMEKNGGNNSKGREKVKYNWKENKEIKGKGKGSRRGFDNNEKLRMIVRYISAFESLLNNRQCVRDVVLIAENEHVFVDVLLFALHYTHMVRACVCVCLF